MKYSEYKLWVESRENKENITNLVINSIGPDVKQDMSEDGILNISTSNLGTEWIDDILNRGEVQTVVDPSKIDFIKSEAKKGITVQQFVDYILNSSSGV